MSSDIAGLIVFAIIVGGLVGLIYFGKFLSSKFIENGKEDMNFFVGGSSKVICDEIGNDFVDASMGYNACSIYYKGLEKTEDV